MYIGLDVHKEFIQVASIRTASSPVKDSLRIETKKEDIIEFIKTLSKKDEVILESNVNSYEVVNLFRSHGIKATVSNPIKTAMIAKSNVKTDKVDAEVLARLLASGYAYTVWQPPLDISDLRKLLSFYGAVTTHSIMIKNRIHAILIRNLVRYDNVPRLFLPIGRKFLDIVVLPEYEKFQFDAELKSLDCVVEELKVIKKRIADYSNTDEEIRRLMTIPGIDFLSGAYIKATIGDIRRFPTHKNLVSYLGLNPRIRQSGNASFSGPITKSGSIRTRFVIINAAQRVVTAASPLRAFYRRIKRRSTANKAKVATASKLARIIWYMLTKKEDFYYIQPLKVVEKLAKLRILSTGVKLPTSRVPGQPHKGGKRVYKENVRKQEEKVLIDEKNYEEFVSQRTGIPVEKSA